MELTKELVDEVKIVDVAPHVDAWIETEFLAG